VCVPRNSGEQGSILFLDPPALARRAPGARDYASTEELSKLKTTQVLAPFERVDSVARAPA